MNKGKIAEIVLLRIRVTGVLRVVESIPPRWLLLVLI
jgi:hypothetical protein